MTHEDLNLVFVENKTSGNKLILSHLKPSSESQSLTLLIRQLFRISSNTWVFLVPSVPLKYRKNIIELHSRFFIYFDFQLELGCNQLLGV